MCSIVHVGSNELFPRDSHFFRAYIRSTHLFPFREVEV